MNDTDDHMEEGNTRKDKRSKKQEKREKICSFCGEPPTRHDLCNRCRQKVESRSKRQVAQKFEKCGECGCAFAAYLRRCVNFGLEPAKLTFFTTLSLMNQIYPIWHLRHESDQLFMDERGTVNSRWNMPDSHIEKVFVNLYKKMKENPILDGKECDANRRFSRNEINRILEQKLEQTLKDFGILHQFSFSGNAYCSNENDNNNNDNNDNNGNNSNNTSQKPTINGRNEEDSNMESNPQSRQSNSRSRSRNNSNDNSEGGQSFVGPRISMGGQYSNNNNNNNDMSNNIISDNGGMNDGINSMNAFSFDLSMPPQAPRIEHSVSNESYLMRSRNMNGERAVAGAAGVGLSSSTPVSPMVAGQGRRFSRMAISRVALPSLPQEAPMLWNANFEEFVGFAHSSANDSNHMNGNNGNNNVSSGNNSNDGNNVGSMTPRLITQMDGNVTDHGYMSSNDESYDSSDNNNNQANSNGNVSNVSNGSNINGNNVGSMMGYENFDDMIPHFSLNENDNESVGSSQINWNSNYFYHNYNYNMASSSVFNFNDNESVANFGGTDNWENRSIISALPMAPMAPMAPMTSMTSVPLGYDRVRGTDTSLQVVSANDMNNNNDNNRLWDSSLAPIEELRNRFHDLGDNDLI